LLLLAPPPVTPTGAPASTYTGIGAGGAACEKHSMTPPDCSAQHRYGAPSGACQPGGQFPHWGGGGGGGQLQSQGGHASPTGQAGHAQPHPVGAPTVNPLQKLAPLGSFPQQVPA